MQLEKVQKHQRAHQVSAKQVCAYVCKMLSNFCFSSELPVHIVAGVAIQSIEILGSRTLAVHMPSAQRPDRYVPHFSFLRMFFACVCSVLHGIHKSKQTAHTSKERNKTGNQRKPVISFAFVRCGSRMFSRFPLRCNSGVHTELPASQCGQDSLAFRFTSGSLQALIEHARNARTDQGHQGC